MINVQDVIHPHKVTEDLVLNHLADPITGLLPLLLVSLRVCDQNITAANEVPDGMQKAKRFCNVRARCVAI